MSIRMLSFTAVCARVFLSKTTVNKMIGNGDFPKPANLGERTKRWSSSVIDRWINEQHEGKSNYQKCCDFLLFFNGLTVKERQEVSDELNKAHSDNITENIAKIFELMRGIENEQQKDC